MDFANLDIALSALSTYDTSSPASLACAVSTKILSQSLDMTQALGASMIQMMEHSVAPELGGTIDTYV